MPRVDACLSLPQLRPGTVDAFHRAVQEACDLVDGLSGPSAALAGAHAAGPSLVRSAALDSDMRFTYPQLAARLVPAAAVSLVAPDRPVPMRVDTLSDDGAAAAPGHVGEAAPIAGHSPDEARYYEWIAAEVLAAARKRMREPPLARGPGDVELKPGMCRLISTRSLLEGIEFSELHGEPSNTYEFVLRFPVHKHYLCVWTIHWSGEATLLLECDNAGSTIDRSPMPPGQGMSQVFRIEWESDSVATHGLVILRIEGGRKCFAGVRLYLKAI